MLELEKNRIVAGLAEWRESLTIEVVEKCPSTNAELLTRAARDAPSGLVLIARRQTAGKGRMGRRWYAHPDTSLAFSMLWRLPRERSPVGISLAAGVALAQALEASGERKLALKWPNDLLRDGRKVAGILVELTGKLDLAVVIGIGINLGLPPDLPSEVAATSAALSLPHEPNQLLATILRRLAGACARFADEGFHPFHADYLQRHAYTGQRIILSSSEGSRAGLCQGIDEEGALLFVDEDGTRSRILSGELSLRPL